MTSGKKNEINREHFDEKNREHFNAVILSLFSITRAFFFSLILARARMHAYIYIQLSDIFASMIFSVHIHKARI